MADNYTTSAFSSITPVLTLQRLGPDVNTGEERGYLKVMWTGDLFSTRENDANLKYSSLRVGTYKMKHDWKIEGRKVKCLRPVESPIQKVLIHDAANDDPNTLSGCIAPGIIGGEADWQNSALAMEKLWEALGSFEVGKEVVLVVLNNATGVDPFQGRTGWRGLK
jgi:hypothetical protein